MEINFTANLKDTKKGVPLVKFNELTTDVYFIVDGTLYKGTYHINECFYAYKVCGSFDCFASKNGTYKSMGDNRENKICTHWCYINELKIEI